MPTNINATSEEKERPTLSSSSTMNAEDRNGDGGKFAPDDAFETQIGAESTGAERTKSGNESWMNDVEEGAVGNKLKEYGGGDEGDGNNAGDNFEASSEHEAAPESATATGKKLGSGDGVSKIPNDPIEEKMDDEEMDSTTRQTTTSKQTKSSGVEIDDEATIGIYRSNHHESYLPESRSSVATKPAFRNQKQDDFVKSGARVKALLTTALRAVADGFASNATANSCSDVEGDKNDKAMSNQNDEGSKKPWQAKTDFAHVQDIAQEKTEECMALKRKLQEAQSQMEVLQKDDADSQQTNTQLKAKIDRTLEALQIAGGNAANARAEADASNARAESLSSQLNDLQSVIEETKRGMEIVRREHDEVSRGARAVEGRLIQVESELIRAARAKKDAVEDRDLLKARAEKSEKLARALQDKVDDYHDEVRLLKKDLLEMEEMEKVRSDRTQRIETEFQDSRASLLEASSAAAEAESCVTSLRSIIEELRRENESLHEQMNASRDNKEKDRAKQNDALIIVEREAQKMKMRAEEGEEEIRTLKMDKTSAEKQVEVLKCRVANMERRLNDSSKQFSQTEKTPAAASSSMITPHSSNNLGFINSFAATGSAVVSDESNKRKYVAELPQRESLSNVSFKAPTTSTSRQLTYSLQKEKENKSNLNNQDHLKRSESLAFGGGQKRKIARSNKCCLCSKEGGMILTCQCDSIDCEKRAHAICIGRFRSAEKSDSKTILCQIASK